MLAFNKFGDKRTIPQQTWKTNLIRAALQNGRFDPRGLFILELVSTRTPLLFGSENLFATVSIGRYPVAAARTTFTRVAP